MRYNRRWLVQSYRQKQVFDAIRKRTIVMRCPKCGNEVSQDEAFCGQCGTPTSPPAHPTEMVYTPPQRSGLLNSYNPNNTYNTNNPNPPSIPPLPPNAYSTGMLP